MDGAAAAGGVFGGRGMVLVLVWGRALWVSSVCISRRGVLVVLAGSSFWGGLGAGI